MVALSACGLGMAHSASLLEKSSLNRLLMHVCCHRQASCSGAQCRAQGGRAGLFP